MSPRSFTNTFKVGAFTCEMTFTLGANRIEAQWRPRSPRRGELSKAEMRQYRDGRDALMAEVAGALCGNVLVIE